jgi:hypothetical protein
MLRLNMHSLKYLNTDIQQCYINLQYSSKYEYISFSAKFPFDQHPMNNSVNTPEELDRSIHTACSLAIHQCNLN